MDGESLLCSSLHVNYCTCYNIESYRVLELGLSIAFNSELQGLTEQFYSVRILETPRSCYMLQGSPLYSYRKG